MPDFIKVLQDMEALNRFKAAISRQHSHGKLKAAFISSVKENTSGLKKVAVLFSGGVDSALVAKAVSEEVKETVLFCSGTSTAPDLNDAEKAAKQLNLPLVKIIVKEKELPSLINESKKIINSNAVLQLQIAVPELASMQEAKRQGFEFVFCGQGSDELFCGYNSFRKVLAEKGFDGVQEEIWNKLENLWEHDLKRDLSIAEHFKLKLKAPFLYYDFALQAMAFPSETKIFSPEDELRKHPIRQLAKELGLPASIYAKRKKAIQYGSGIASKVSGLI